MKFLGLDVLDDLITKIKNKVETELSTKANITSLNQKQDKLTAGANITIDQNNVISATGGGGGGTTDYTQLSNKPSINNIILNGNKTLNDLNIQGKLTAGANINITNNEISSITVKVLEDSVTLQDGSTCDLATGFYYTDVWEVEFQGTSQTTIVIGQCQLFYFEGGQAQTFITPAFQVYYTTDTHKWQKFLNDYNTDVIVDDNYKIPTSKAVYDALDYSALPNKPSINNVTLVGNKTGSDLGLGDVPVGSIVQFDGNTIPTGYVEVNGPEIYSTTEQKVGTWIDGRPLYRRVIAGQNTTSTTSGGASYRVTVTGIEAEEVRWFDGYGYSSVPAYIPLGYLGVTYVSDTLRLDNYFFGNFRKYNGVNEIFYRTTYALTNVTFIVLYTKSTDTAS